MTLELRTLQGRIKSGNLLDEVAGYVLVTAVAGTDSGGFDVLPIVKDLDGDTLMIFPVRADFGRSTDDLIRHREVPLGSVAPVDVGLWSIPLVPTDTDQTDPTPFAYLVQVFIDNDEIVRKVIEVPAGSTPVNFNSTVSMAPGASLFGSLVTFADFDALAAQVTATVGSNQTSSTRDPGAGDDYLHGYAPGKTWVNTSFNPVRVWYCYASNPIGLWIRLV